MIFVPKVNMISTNSPYRAFLLIFLTALLVKQNESRPPERLNYTQLLSKPYFVDKSELLKVFLEGSQFNLVTCPRRFGKSVNLQMIKLFTEMELDEDSVAKHYTNTSAYHIFKNMKIFENISFVEQHMCKYVVVHVDLLYNKSVNNFTHDVALQFINDKFYDAFAKFCWLLRLPKDVLLKRGLQEDEIKFLERINHKKIIERDLQDSLKHLGRILRKFFNAKMIFLLDNYDNVMVNGLSKLRYDIETLYVYLGEVINGIFIHSDDLVYTGMIFSTSKIVIGVKDMYYEKVEQNLFLENHKFSQYFGFTELEVDGILNKTHNHDEDAKKIMTDYYGAYVTREKKLRIYSPFSVTQYCEHANESEPIRNYYIYMEKGVDDLFQTMFRFLEFRDLAEVYGTVDTFTFDPIDKCTQVDFSSFLGLVEKKDCKMKKYDFNLFMTFAMEEGFVGYAFDHKNIKFKWPNLEIKNTMKQCVHRYKLFLHPELWGTENDTETFVRSKKLDDYLCGGLKGCVKCDKDGGTALTAAEGGGTPNGTSNSAGSSTYRCVKCVRLIVIKTRQCVDTCPSGYTEEWSTQVDYMGRICKETLAVAGIPMSGQKLAIFLGASIGTLVCLLMLVSGVIYLKYRRNKTLTDKARRSPTLGHLTGTHRSQDSDDSERPEFLKQLAYLRPDAPVFLAMLNETRRQVRELRRPSRQNSAMQAYRPVLKDLSRILILLNRPEDRIGVPPADWETLLAWGERVLRRYKKQNPDQVAQLLGFTQLPVEDSDSPILDPSPYPTHLTTFSSSTDCKLQSPRASTNQLQQLAISAFDEAYNNHTRNRGSEDEDCATTLKREEMTAFVRPSSLLDSGVDVSSPHNTTGGNRDWETEKNHSTILAEWSSAAHITSRRSCYYPSADEDDFYTLGFRPQDEITTEL